VSSSCPSLVSIEDPLGLPPTRGATQGGEFTGDVVARRLQLADEQVELRLNPYHESDPTLAGPDEEDR
jgi:hypothetical protein